MAEEALQGSAITRECFRLCRLMHNHESRVWYSNEPALRCEATYSAATSLSIDPPYGQNQWNLEVADRGLLGAISHRFVLSVREACGISAFQGSRQNGRRTFKGAVCA